MKTLAVRILGGLAVVSLVGAVGGCYSRRHIEPGFGAAVKAAAAAQVVHKGSYVAAPPNGLEPGDTNLVLDAYYATLKGKQAQSAAPQPVGVILTEQKK
jgi:hypothetical protein